MLNRWDFIFEFTEIILIGLLGFLIFPSGIKLFVNVINESFHFIT